MTVLRWILLVAGLLVIAGVYFWGRRNRPAPVSDRPRSAAANPELHDADIPQLDQPVITRTRVVERPVVASGDASSDGLTDLPPMHADVRGSSSEPLQVRTALPLDPQTSISTGAFIAAQAQPIQAQPAHVESFEGEVERVPLTSTSGSVATPTPATTMETTSRPAKKPASRKIIALRLSAGSERVEGARLKSLLEAAGLRHGKYSIYHRLHDELPLFSVASMVEPGTFDPYAMSGVQFPGVTLFTQLPGPIDGSEMFAQMLACARELEQGIGGLLQDERGLPLTEQRAQRLRDDVADFLHLLGQS